MGSAHRWQRLGLDVWPSLVHRLLGLGPAHLRGWAIGGAFFGVTCCCAGRTADIGSAQTAKAALAAGDQEEAGADLAYSSALSAPDAAKPDVAQEVNVLTERVVIGASDPRVSVMGRVERDAEGQLRFGYPGVSLRLRVEAPALSVHLRSTSPDSAIGVLVDGEQLAPLRWGGEQTVLPVFEGRRGMHEVQLTHLTETWRGVVSVSDFELPDGGRFLPSPATSERRLLFIGDSVTCGEAVERRAGCKKDASWWNAAESYGMLTGAALGADTHLVCYGGRGLIRDWQGKRDTLNGPQFFELAVPDGAGARRWDHAAFSPHAIVVSLGTNDFSLGIGALPQREDFVTSYLRFLKRIREVHPDARVVLTDGAIVDDAADPKRPQKTVLVSYLEETVRRLADSGVSVFVTEHQPGDECDAHPTKAQHVAMASAMTELLRELLGW